VPFGEVPDNEAAQRALAASDQYRPAAQVEPAARRGHRLPGQARNVHHTVPYRHFRLAFGQRDGHWRPPVAVKGVGVDQHEPAGVFALRRADQSPDRRGGRIGQVRVLVCRHRASGHQRQLRTGEPRVGEPRLGKGQRRVDRRVHRSRIRSGRRPTRDHRRRRRGAEVNSLPECGEVGIRGHGSGFHDAGAENRSGFAGRTRPLHRPGEPGGDEQRRAAVRAGLRGRGAGQRRHVDGPGAQRVDGGDHNAVTVGERDPQRAVVTRGQVCADGSRTGRMQPDARPGEGSAGTTLPSSAGLPVAPACSSQ
jgi:hypothetical protein